MEILTIVYLFFIFITLYFMFLFLILFFKNRPDKTELIDLTYFPSLTVLIPAFNEEATIADTVKAVRNSDYPKNKLKILVVNHASTDNTAKILKKLRVNFINYFKMAGKGKAYALNYGLKHVKTEFVAILDADAFPDKSALSKLIQFFKDKEVAAVTASILVKSAKNMLQRLQELEYAIIVWVRKLLEYLSSVYATPGGLSIYRKKILDKVGNFDTKNLTEDIEIAWRLLDKGYEIRVGLGARSYVKVPETLKKWWKQRIRWDIGGMQTMLKYKSALLNHKKGMLGLFVAPFFLGLMVLSLFGFFILLGIFSLRAYSFVLSIIYASSAHVSALAAADFFISNLFLIFGIIVFGVSLIYVYIGLRVFNKRIRGIRNFFELMLYLTIYLMAFPILLLQSIYRLAVYKEHTW